MTILARTANRDADYARLALKPDRVEPWEDGMRTDGGRGSYEWWYFDAHLEDGTSMVITFFTKESLATWTGLRPYATAEIDRPGEPKRTWKVTADPREFSATRDHCEVRVKGSSIVDQGDGYAIHFEDDDVSIDVRLRPHVPAWRPATGHFYFGPRDQRLFAWLPAVPQGEVTATITENATSTTLGGIGYHDHNWGDASMMRLMNHWYWGRAQAGPYSVIASWLVAEKKYGDTEIPIFMLAKDGRIIADDPQRVRLRLEDVFLDEPSRKPVANDVIYEYAGDEESYRVTFHREKTLVTNLAADVEPASLRALVKLAGIDGAYLRFTGTVSVERSVGGSVVEREQDPGIWELMYFGHVRPA